MKRNEKNIKILNIICEVAGFSFWEREWNKEKKVKMMTVDYTNALKIWEFEANE